LPYTRRDALKLGLFGSAALAIPLERAARADSVLDNRMPAANLPKPFTLPFSVPEVAVPVPTDGDEETYRVSMRPFKAVLLPGFETTVWGYDTVPGRTFQIQQGRKTKIRFVNDLPLTHPTLKFTPWTSVHLHGSPSLPQFDGYANDLSFPGQYKDYHYPNTHHATTHWYHDHGVHHTAQNVWMGLAGQYHIHDDRELSLPIPHGDFDVPIIYGDLMFDKTGELLFTSDGHDGQFGDVILVNGVPWPTMKVKRRKYRFRLLNASVSRAYNLSLSNGDTFAVICTDGGLMPAPQYVKSLRHIMAERYEIVIDFAKYNPGTKFFLKNTNPPNNTAFTNTDKIMQFEVVDGTFDDTDNEVPDVLFPENEVMTLQPSQSVKRRTLELKRDNGLWTVNGHVWDDVIASNFTLLEANPRSGSVETWDLKNSSGGWQHPLHIHFIDFQILSRNGRAPFAYERGPKDVAYLGENETVRVLAKFPDRGKYMMHCHNLVHEDHDMMVQYEIQDPNQAGDDPLGFPAKPNSGEANDPL